MSLVLDSAKSTVEQDSCEGLKVGDLLGLMVGDLLGTIIGVLVLASVASVVWSEVHSSSMAAKQASQ